MPEPLSLVLASTSRYRAALLARLGVAFEVAAPGVDERAFDDRWAEWGPERYALAVARAKAEAVAARMPGKVVLGADQVAVVDEAGVAARLDKPMTPERNVAALMRLAGREHELVSGIVLVDGRSGRSLEHVDRQRLRMRPFTREEAEAYVARCAPLDCAGGYRIEDAGIALFSRVTGEDPTGIEGLPLIAVARMLRELAR